MSSFKVGYFVGSLSTSSINRVLAKALVRIAPSELFGYGRGFGLPSPTDCEEVRRLMSHQCGTVSSPA